MNQKSLAAALVAALSLTMFSAATAAETKYEFRVPLPGLNSATPACPPELGTAGWMLPSSGAGTQTIPAGCTTVKFQLIGTRYVGPDSVWTPGDQVLGEYVIPSGGSTAITYNWLPNGSVVLYVNGVQIAAAAGAGSGEQSRVANGATAIQITYSDPVPAGGWLQGNSGMVSIWAR